jgi:lipoprotein-releasing system ATP-binding protein
LRSYKKTIRLKYKILTHPTILSTKGLKKSYHDLTVLDLAAIEIASNQVTTIVGPSGAGKSTLLHILGTLLKPSEGEIWIENHPTTEMNDDQLAGLRNQFLGFVFQTHHLLPEFTAIENVSLPAMIGQKKSTEYIPRAKELLEFIGLKDRIHHKPSELSGGEQQRVSIARALINHPKMIFADEPTGNLDTKNALDIHDLFFRLKNEFGYSFLIVTHNPELAKMSDRIIEMKDGKLV